MKTSCWICLLGATSFATLAVSQDFAWAYATVGWLVGAVMMQCLAPDDDEQTY